MSAEPRRDDRPPPPPVSAQGGAAHRTATVESVAERTRAELFGPAAAERRRVALSLAAAALVAAAHVARVGTPAARITAATLLALVVVVPPIVGLAIRRRGRDPKNVLRAASFALGRAEVSRALEHAALSERIERSADHEGVSPALARLHASRALAKLDLARLAPTGERFAHSARLGALVLLSLALIVLAVAPVRFVEGVDVGLARKGVAPLPLAWVDDVEMTTHPPAYLHKHPTRFHGYGGVVADRGAELVFRGIPKRAGRTLMLADEHREVPFVDDGSGGIVAHWPVAVSGRLRIRARFGAVVIEEPYSWDLIAVQDEIPRVVLEGAPGSIEIAKTEGSVPLRYDAFDDHGLREVHLVIRIGTREERRVLAKLDGDPKHDRGGYVLRTTDPLVAKARTPIRIRVEARDNDPITGPKWGKSAELTLIPPLIGAAEAKRYEAMLKERDGLVDLVALASDEGKTTESVQTAFDAAAESLEGFLSKSHDGIRVSPRAALAMRGRLRKAREALAAEAKAKGKTTRDATVTALENVLLSVDGSLRAMGGRDSRTVAKTLADVAEDGAQGLKELETASSQEGAQAEAKSRVDTDVEALDGGGGSLRVLGELGRDLGEIVEAYLKRVARARAANDTRGAELAMRDLALRLKTPVASFGGGGSSNPSSPGDPMDDGEPGEESEGEGDAGDQQKGLEELAKEHGGAIGEVEDHLRAAEDPKQLEGLEEEAKRRAKRLREIVASLPKTAGLKKTLEAAEAAAREKIEGMADSLEKLQLGDARERGDSSLKAVEEARDRAWVIPGADEKLDSVATEVQKQIDWIDDILKKLRKAASEKAKDKLKAVAPREKGLSDKASDMSNESEKKSPLPEHVKELLEQAGQKMKEAGAKLEEGDGEKALELQKEAQKLLEKARDEARSGGGQDPQPHGDEGGEKPDFDQKLEIPDDHKGPAEFRKRVLEKLGTGATSPKLKDSVKRYAEDLIK